MDGKLLGSGYSKEVSFFLLGWIFIMCWVFVLLGWLVRVSCACVHLYMLCV